MTGLQLPLTKYMRSFDRSKVQNRLRKGKRNQDTSSRIMQSQGRPTKRTVKIKKVKEGPEKIKQRSNTKQITRKVTESSGNCLKRTRKVKES